MLDRRSFKMRMAMLGCVGDLARDNILAIVVMTVLLAGGIALALPGAGKPIVHRATVTAIWPGMGKNNPRPSVDLIFPDGRHETLRLNNAVHCRIGSVLLVTETPKLLRSDMETDRMGCR